MREMTLAQILDAGLCAGCGACAFVVGDGSVSMQINNEGYLRPVCARPLTSDEARSVQAVCPGVGLEHRPSRNEGVTYQPLWGPTVRVMAGHATDETTRHRGSSGGVLSALLIHLIESGQVDFVVHTKADEANPLVNVTGFSRSREEVLGAAGSRYAPAAPVAALREALAQDGRFAFVGKPCDVAAVRKILDREPALEARIPFLLSFMCAGTPSIHGTHDILRRLDVRAESVVAFRYRGDGWPGLTRADTRDGTAATMDYNTAWGTILNRTLQPRCKKCADGTGEFADVTGADAWYGKDGYPDFSEADGRSLVISRTSAGDVLLSSAQGAGRVAVEAFAVETLSQIQPYQRRRKAEMVARKAAAVLLGRPWPRYENFSLLKCATQIGFVSTLRAFAGATVRMLKGRV